MRIGVTDGATGVMYSIAPEISIFGWAPPP
jgi:hypothetical protein